MKRLRNLNKLSYFFPVNIWTFNLVLHLELLNNYPLLQLKLKFKEREHFIHGTSRDKLCLSTALVFLIV